MKRAAFIALIAAGLILWKFSAAGLYLAAAVIAAGVIAAAENLADKGEVSVSCDEHFPQKGHAPVLTFGGRKQLKGRVLCENIVTGERSAFDVKIGRTRSFALPAQADCGGLFIRFVQFSRCDLLGLTRRTVVCHADGYITIMPENTDVSAIFDPSSGEEELDGARELTGGEPLRRLNYKLTHRFGKPYVNIYSPENAGDIWLFGDYGLADGAADAAEKLCALAAFLEERGVPFGLALPCGENDVQLTDRADSESVLQAVLHFPLYSCEGHSVLPALMTRLPDDVQVLAFTRNTAFEDDRVTILQ